MDFTPDPDHVAIAEAVDNVCSQFDDTYWSKCDTEHRFPWEFYDQMAKGGWVGILIPEEYGGQGFTFIELAIVLEEMGRNLSPSPFLVTSVGAVGAEKVLMFVGGEWTAPCF